MKTENDYRVVLEFSWKSALGMFRKKNTTNGSFNFLGNQHQALQRAYSLVYNFFGQNWMSTFQKSRSLKISFLNILVATKWLDPTMQFWVKFSLLQYIMVAVWGVNPCQNVEEIPRGIPMQYTKYTIQHSNMAGKSPCQWRLKAGKIIELSRLNAPTVANSVSPTAWHLCDVSASCLPEMLDKVTGLSG